LHKAISEIPVGPELQDFPYRDPFPSENAPKHFDYNHLLPPEHQGKYAMVVTQTPDFAPKPEDHDSDKSGPWHFPVNKGKHHLTANLFKLLPAFKTREAAEASITKPKERWTKFDHDWVKEQSTPRRAFVGHAIGHIDNGELSPHFSDGIAPEFKGMKFGTALYSAIFAHARNGLGAHTVKGGLHTVEAARVHESLSRQHGMAYKSTVRKMPKNPKVNTPAHMIRYRIPGGRKITQLRGPYKYALKNELSPLKKALARWENKVFGDIFDLLAKIEAPTIHQSDFLKELQDFGWMPDGDNKHKDSQVHIAGPSWTGFQHSDDAILNAKKQEKYLKQLGLTRFPHRAQWHFAINPRLGKLAAGQGEDALRARHLFEAYKAGGYLDTHSMDAVRAKADAEKAHDNPMPEDAEIEKAKARALSAQAAIARRTAGA
jgi:GNAT superfamily N-acetyltransferase